MINHRNIVVGPKSPEVTADHCFGRYMLDRIKCTRPDLPALINGETNEIVKYSELLTRTINVSLSLRENHGLNKGDVVSICSENRAEYFITALAVFYCGGIVNNTNPMYTTDEIKHVISLSKPKFIFLSPDTKNILTKLHSFYRFDKVFIFNEQSYTELEADINVDVSLFDTIDRKPYDTAVINYSSGTTGLPKGVLTSNHSILISTVTYNTSHLFKSNNINKILISLPWFHAYSFSSILSFLANSFTIVYQPRFQLERYLSCIQNYKIATILAVPPIIVQLYKSELVDRYDISTLKCVISSAAPLPVVAYEQFKNKVGTNVRIYQMFGMTETTNCIFICNNPDKFKSIGTLIPGFKAKIVNERNEPLPMNETGELLVKGGSIMSGYINHDTSELFDPDGFMRTGDIAYYDEHGFFYIIDRIKELIKYKGNQVPPAEVEKVLMKHPSVMDCAVVGKPDVEAGELPTAFVVIKSGANTTAKEIVDHVASQISPMKHLRGGVVFIDQIPKNPSGKILRRELKKIITQNKSKI